MKISNPNNTLSNAIGSSINSAEANKAKNLDAEKKSARAEAAALKSDSITSSAKEKGINSSDNLFAPARVNLSDRAQAMQRAKEIASEDTIDEAKVARLQKMIDEGSYNVNADEVADRLVDTQMMFPD